ncbi:hypothetical protein GMO_18600 [Gluconobacter morbifer G707]|uniref:Uncharacterized protein n=1 Tax=Gluconobacter morbifer G707 TaxID=1088869 RepID=G6XJI8_9PROT|nr:hypothetical protein GMO_18600 [Gluconobacter morbifer G707]
MRVDTHCQESSFCVQKRTAHRRVGRGRTQGIDRLRDGRAKAFADHRVRWQSRRGRQIRQDGVRSPRQLGRSQGARHPLPRQKAQHE